MPPHRQRVSPSCVDKQPRDTCQGERTTFRTRDAPLLSGALPDGVTAACSVFAEGALVRAACSLAPLESRTFCLQVTLPSTQPPTFRGTAARCVCFTSAMRLLGV